MSRSGQAPWRLPPRPPAQHPAPTWGARRWRQQRCSRRALRERRTAGGPEAQVAGLLPMLHWAAIIPALPPWEGGCAPQHPRARRSRLSPCSSHCASTSATPPSPAPRWQIATRPPSTWRPGPTRWAASPSGLRAPRLGGRLPAEPDPDAGGHGRPHQPRSASPSPPSIAPFHDPLRLAEDMVVLDNLSRGPGGHDRGRRLRPRGVRHVRRADERAGRRVTEAVTTLKAAFTGEPFEYRGRTVHVTPAALPPRWPRRHDGRQQQARR